MGYSLNPDQTAELLNRLAEDYRIYAPKRFPKQGRYSDTDIIRYDRIQTPDEIVWDQKSDYPAKEVISPIQQALFYFTEDEYRESKKAKKPVLLLARPCDITAQLVQEKIYAENGGFKDLYYDRVHNKVKFAVMDCGGGDDTCFCVSMGSNKPENYSLAFKFDENGLKAEVSDDCFADYFDGMPEDDFTPEFVEENELKVTIQDLSDRDVRLALKSHPMWKEFDKRCISCGSCTVACSTCTCFTTRDICYGDNPEVGERRRVTASCQVAGFDQMAGQREIRSTAGDRMRYKILHKFHDHKARFGDRHMCVGCGRCTHMCPEFISISATVNKMADAVDEIKASLADGGNHVE